jgi:CheY-like chemotaxis protein
MKILLVDDDSDDQMLFKEVLQGIDETLTYVIANNGEEALNMLKSDPDFPDIIFLDLNMPRMDGRTCLEKIRASDDLKHLNVVIVSTSISGEDEAVFMMAGARFMEKPSEYDKLSTMLEAHINLVKMKDSMPWQQRVEKQMSFSTPQSE